MKAHGFINNRVLDALACGLPVVSDCHGEFARLFPDEIAYYRDRTEFDACMERMLLDYPAMQGRAESAGARIPREFTFEQRAGELLDLVADVQRSP
jgi:spore maturation protein CgeB